MRNTLVLTGKELRQMFLSPIAYTFLAVFAFFLFPDSAKAGTELAVDRYVTSGLLAVAGIALRLAGRRGLRNRDADRLRQLIRRLDPPALPAVDPTALLAAMARDKKARESGLVWVLPEALGRGQMVTDVGKSELRGELAAFLDDPWA